MLIYQRVTAARIIQQTGEEAVCSGNSFRKPTLENVIECLNFLPPKWVYCTVYNIRMHHESRSRSFSP